MNNIYFAITEEMLLKQINKHCPTELLESSSNSLDTINAILPFHYEITNLSIYKCIISDSAGKILDLLKNDNYFICKAIINHENVIEGLRCSLVGDTARLMSTIIEITGIKNEFKNYKNFC